LDVGNVERIDAPSAEHVRHFLRFMPPDAPYVILAAADDSCIQATPDGEGYRVEYRDGKRQYFALVSYEQAARLFEAYRTGEQSIRQAVPWRRLSVMNDPYHPARLVVLALMLITLAALGVWFALR
jgi:hypothetical protein